MDKISENKIKIGPSIVGFNFKPSGFYYKRNL